MNAIKVQTQVGSASAVEVQVLKIEVKESEAASNLRRILKESARPHTYSIAQLVGIYPA